MPTIIMAIRELNSPSLMNNTGYTIMADPIIVFAMLVIT